MAHTVGPDDVLESPEIRWLMGKIHVATSDYEVAREIIGRVRKVPANRARTDYRNIRNAMVRGALQAHHRNQETYRAVMGR